LLNIVGLGPGSPELLTTETVNLLLSSEKVILRTDRHPAVAKLIELGIEFTTCDQFYEQFDNFEQVYAAITEYLLLQAQNSNIVYAVPGSPMVAEQTVLQLREFSKKHNTGLRIHSAISFLDELFSRLKIDPLEHGLTIIDVNDIWQLPATLNTPLVITQVYDARTLSEAKISLAELYGDEYQVIFAANLGLPNEIIEQTAIFELDRNFTANHLTSIFVPRTVFSQEAFDLQQLTDIMASLRSKDGCVWDNEQTALTLRRYIIEEVYEVLEAIDEKNPNKLCDELGDLLLQIVFHARIAEENGDFAVQDVINGVCEKMIRRHPHVFGETTVRDAAEVLINWEKIKAREKGCSRSVLAGVPKGLPALMFAQKLQEKAAKVGFDWPSIIPVWEKISEELEELKCAISNQDVSEIESEFGDVIFSVVNLGRFLKLETALIAANRKFSHRFEYVEQKIAEKGDKWHNYSLEALDKLWEEAKI